MRRLAFVLGTLALGCDGGMPIKYEVCDQSGKDCHLVARFHDFSDCEHHRKLSSMLCDSSKPGVVHCIDNGPSQVSSSHCTK